MRRFVGRDTTTGTLLDVTLFVGLYDVESPGGLYEGFVCGILVL